jgi:hypothetical protein
VYLPAFERSPDNLEELLGAEGFSDGDPCPELLNFLD